MADAGKGLRLYNTLTREKEPFAPIDPDNVRMYVCGPTVYDFAHIGNARPVIVFDVLYRLLRHLYGADHVTYVRNITDVDDKINDRALRDFGAEIRSGSLSLNEAIRRVTGKTADQFHADVKALGCLEPDFEPRATEHIPGMVEMAQALIDRGHAYLATGAEGREVLFDVSSMPDYGRLSNRRLEDQQAGARVEVKDHKKNPGDFVLWKESGPEQPGWPAHFHWQGGHVDIFGRPGWHIECSVMSSHHLGNEFDIHGGGIDLIFPHHENEIAQSRCAHGTDVMAKVWMHNGFVQVEGRKMSKSEGNFVTIHDLLHTTKFGGRSWPGEVLRLAMLMTHYREPIDFSVRRLEEAYALWRSLNLLVREFAARPSVDPVFEAALFDDLNTATALARIYELRALASKGDVEAGRGLLGSLRLLGFYEHSFSVKLQLTYPEPIDSITAGQLLADNSSLALDTELVAIADRLDQSQGVFATSINAVLRAFVAGTTIADVRFLEDRGLDVDKLTSMSAQRLSLIREKNWAEADRIRDELAAQGIQLKDGKDPVTGERVTTWEVKR